MQVMDFYLLVILLVIIAGFGLLFFYLRRITYQNQKLSGDSQFLVLLQNQINELNKTLQKQFGESLGVVKEVTEKLVKLDETNKQVLDFSHQLRSLQDTLKNPKQRGVLGEYYLETLLKNIFPPNAYQMQYEFKGGQKVDAVIFYQDKIIPIDSKFSLENYNRLAESKGEEERRQLEKAFRQDLKNRIDETAKYIRPAEGTTDFAFMFIPAEAIYYDLLVNQIGSVKSSTRDLIEYAYKDKKVIIVSPTSFAAYLQTVMQGMRAQQIERSAKEIIIRVQNLGRHLKVYEEYMMKLGQHLRTVVNSYNTAYKELGKIDKDIAKIGGRSAGVEIKKIEKPLQDNDDI